MGALVLYTCTVLELVVRCVSIKIQMEDAKQHVLFMGWFCCLSVLDQLLICT